MKFNTQRDVIQWVVYQEKIKQLNFILKRDGKEMGAEREQALKQKIKKLRKYSNQLVLSDY